MSVDILNMEWISQGRDPNIVEPVLSFLEKNRGMKVARDSIWYGEYKLLKYRPRALLIANGTGASNNFNIVKLADRLGIVTIEMVSEGIFYEQDEKMLATRFWGHNKDRRLYSDLALYWSENSKEKIKAVVNQETISKIQISGATGFDRYKLLKFMGKEEFLKRISKENYKKVIGIGGWAFDYFEGDREAEARKHYSREVVDFFKSQRQYLLEIYGKIIAESPDILFVLKYHPGCDSKENSEFCGLSDFENVVELKNDMAVADIISGTDLWIAFDSTTCLEAWCLGKETFLVNPDPEFERGELYKGSPIARKAEEVIGYIDEHFRAGKIADFEKLKQERADLVERTIQWDDGRNFQRAAHVIEDVYRVKVGTKKKKIDGFVCYVFLKMIARWIVFHTPLRLIWKKKYETIYGVESTYDQSERERLAAEYKRGIEEFIGR